VSASQINLTWTDNAANETGFRIERSSNGTSFTQIATVGVNVTSYANSGLSASTQFWYRVRAYNTAGNSAYTNTATATTLAPPPQPPAAPSGLNGTRQSAGMRLTWTDRSNNETGFIVQRSADGQAFSTIATVGANVVTYLDSNSGSSRWVYYRVRATNAIGDSPFSNTVRERNR
jgi:titin